MKIDMKKLTPSPSSAFADLMGAAKNDITQIPLDKLSPYPNQPFKAYNDDKLLELAEDIEINGIISPIIVRPFGEAYQILAGHNRANAARLAGISTAPCIIKEVDDDIAQLILVNTNLNQRQELLPSEKAFAYKMQADALKSGAHNVRTTSELAEYSSDSKRNIQYYIRLTSLISDLIVLVDNGGLPFRSGVELSYLTQEQQELVRDFIRVSKKRIPVDKAAEIRRFAEKDLLDKETLEDLLLSKKRSANFSIPADKVKRFFKEGTSPEEMTEKIIQALEFYELRKGENDV